MKRNIVFLLSVVGIAVLIWAARKPAPPAPSLDATSSRVELTPKQPAKPVARQLAIAAFDAAAASQDRARQLAVEIESALVSQDAGRRETAFSVLLPELLRTQSARVIDMVARHPAGEQRDALRDEVARQWITRDTEAAVVWLQSLGEEGAVTGPIAVRALAAVSPAQAIDFADRLGVGRDDGSVEHILQIWAAESPREARRWVENQPENAHTAQLRARLPR